MMTLADLAGPGASSSSGCGALLVSGGGDVDFHGSKLNSDRGCSVVLSEVQMEWFLLLVVSLSLPSSDEAGPKIQGRDPPRWWCGPSRTMAFEDADGVELFLCWLIS